MIKSAEEWMNDVWDEKGGHDGLGIFNCHEDWVKQIQLDAYRAGMLRAATLSKGSFNFYPFSPEQITEEANNPDLKLLYDTHQS